MKDGTIVAFKTKNDVWLTGIISFYQNETSYMIELIIHIEPQYYEDDEQTFFFHNDIKEIKILEVPD